MNVVGDAEGDTISGFAGGRLVGGDVNRMSGCFVGDALGDMVTGDALGDMVVGVRVGSGVGRAVGDGVAAHSVQHSQPCASQSTLRTSMFLKRQISFGKLPVKSLFPNVSTCKFLKSERLLGTHPVKLLSLNANLTSESKSVC